jgi:hypothetical protein
MQAMTVRWVRDQCTRRAALACVASVVTMSPATGQVPRVTEHFDIKAQPLSEALMTFGAQTGSIVMASSTLTVVKVSNPVYGQMTIEEAMTRMLQGTGLTFEKSAPGTFLILPRTSGR